MVKVTFTISEGWMSMGKPGILSHARLPPDWTGSTPNGESSSKMNTTLKAKIHFHFSDASSTSTKVKNAYSATPSTNAMDCTIT